MALELKKVGDTSLVVIREFKASRAGLWACFSEPEKVKYWMTGPPGHSMPVCELDFVEGGKWRYVWKTPVGLMEAYGEYKQIVPLSLIEHTETFASWPDHETRVETRFSEMDSSSKLEMKISYDSTETRDAVAQSGMEQGLESSFMRLDNLLND